MKSGAVPEAELSRVTAIDRVGPEGIDLTVEANAVERERLAGRFGLIAVESLQCVAQLRREERGKIYYLSGRLTATVVQSCVITLEPVRNWIDEQFERRYAVNKGETMEAEIRVDVFADDPPEPIVGAVIDVGEAIAEQLGLTLDPYPRSPGAEWPRAAAPESSGQAAPGPFAKLAGLGAASGGLRTTSDDAPTRARSPRQRER